MKQVNTKYIVGLICIFVIGNIGIAQAQKSEVMEIKEFCQAFSEDTYVDRYNPDYVEGIDSHGQAVITANVKDAKYVKMLKERLVPDDITINLVDAQEMGLTLFQKQYFAESGLGVLNVKDGKVFMDDEPLGELDYLVYLCDPYLRENTDQEDDNADLKE